MRIILVCLSMVVFLAGLSIAQSNGKIKIEVKPKTVEFDATSTPITVPIETVVTYAPPAPSVSELNVLNYGAKPNDGIDDTAAINAALAAGKTQVKDVRLPDGAFQHNGLLYVDSVRLIGNGDSSQLIATNYLKSSVYVRGVGATVDSVRHSFSTTGIARQSHGDTCSFMVDGATGAKIINVTVSGSPSAGIMVYGAKGTSTVPCSIKNCRVSGTLADGIHITKSSDFIRVEGCVITNTRDDGIAVVSYVNNGTTSRNILIADNDVSSVLWGRGITVVGGSSVEILNNKIAQTRQAGILIASEDSWSTLGVAGVRVVGNTLTSCGPATPEGHPALLIHGRSAYLVSDVRVENNKIDMPFHDGIRVDNYVRSIVIRLNTITGVRSGYQAINISAAAKPYVTQ